MDFVVKGAYYYEKETDTILTPHATGCFGGVDCSRFVRMEELKERYDEGYINQVKNRYIEFEGEQYYSAEYSSRIIKDWELLSDLSGLEYVEEKFDW